MEKSEVVENFHHLEKLKFSHQLPKAFTEKGLYMLATILKSSQAIQTTIAIVEAFAKLRELARIVAEMPNENDKNTQKAMAKQTGRLINDLLFNDLDISETESTFKLNLFAVGFEHTVKRKKRE